jgi:hypothetical protein
LSHCFGEAATAANRTDSYIASFEVTARERCFSSYSAGRPAVTLWAVAALRAAPFRRIASIGCNRAWRGERCAEICACQVGLHQLMTGSTCAGQLRPFIE